MNDMCKSAFSVFSGKYDFERGLFTTFATFLVNSHRTFDTSHQWQKGLLELTDILEKFLCVKLSPQLKQII